MQSEEEGTRCCVEAGSNRFLWPRQVDLVEQGLESQIVQETRLFDEGKQVTYPMRTKEGLADYRYFPEPDLPAVNISPDFLHHVKVHSSALHILPSVYKKLSVESF